MFFQTDRNECHDGTQFEKFKVKVYTGVKLEICVNRVKTKHVPKHVQCIPRLTWIQKIYTFTYFQCLSLELFSKKGQGLAFYLYRGQTLKSTRLWMKMVYIICLVMLFQKRNSLQHQMLHYHNNNTKYIELNGIPLVIICFAVLPWQQSICCSQTYSFFKWC